MGALYHPASGAIAQFPYVTLLFSPRQNVCSKSKAGNQFAHSIKIVPLIHANALRLSFARPWPINHQLG